MTIKRENQDIVIRLDGSALNLPDIERIVESLRFTESVSKNEGTEEEAAQLARQSESSW
jgi:hypothetical protein